MPELAPWLTDYVQRQRDLYGNLPLEQVARVVDVLSEAHATEAQVFVFGNGGSAANASHFVTDVGKGASDASKTRFRILSLNDNAAWMTAIGNDYSYDDVYLRQLENYGRPGDVALCMSVSGNSPNLVKAMRWARAQNGLATIASWSAAASAAHWLKWPNTFWSFPTRITGAWKTRR